MAHILPGPSRIKVERLAEWARAPQVHIDNDRFRRACKSAIDAEHELERTQEKLARAQHENAQLRLGVQRAIAALNRDMEN